jgi:ABC-type polysaccharide/polyol phosphate transport system ATPase subunit
MFIRLAFSVVTSVDPDILVVDEALSVGDQHFQKKSMDRMMAFKEQGKALVFCSHNLYIVNQATRPPGYSVRTINLIQESHRQHLIRFHHQW